MSLYPFREERHIDQLYETDDIYDFIGRGTFASVFRAVSLVDGERVRKGDVVALKVFTKRDLTSDKMRMDVINEVEVLRRLNHVNCIRLLDCFHTPLHVVIVTNYVSGAELFKALRDSVFSEDQVRCVVRQLLHALDYLHTSVGVVHRDVKPENILVTPVEGGNWHVTLVDFGLARTFAHRSSSSSSSSNTIMTNNNNNNNNNNTSSSNNNNRRARLGGGRYIIHSPLAPPRSSSVDSLDSTSHTDSPLLATPCGTLNYAAPETVVSLTQSGPLATTPELLPRMDMYAVGTILHVMLAGKLPFHLSGNKMQLVKEMEAGPLFSEARWGNISYEGVELTRALLHFDPKKRPRAREALQFPWFHIGEEEEQEIEEIEEIEEVEKERMMGVGAELVNEEESIRARGSSYALGDENGWQMQEVVGDREYMRRAFDAMRPPESSMCDVDGNNNNNNNNNNNTIGGGGRCISVPFGASRSSVTSYFGFVP